MKSTWTQGERNPDVWGIETDVAATPKRSDGVAVRLRKRVVLVEMHGGCKSICGFFVGVVAYMRSHKSSRLERTGGGRAHFRIDWPRSEAFRRVVAAL
jgi:hypothetical protein